MPNAFTLTCRPAMLQVLAATALAWATAAHAAGPTTQFVLDGAVQHSGTWTLPSLQALPATTQTVNFLSGSTPQTHTYTGASLWGVLNNAGVVLTPGIKNDQLNRYVLATGSDGYKTVYSLGELDPGFGNVQALVAYAETTNGASNPLTSDGFARTTAPLDVKGGRYVSNLAHLTVAASASKTTSVGGGVSTSFTVTGDVKHTASVDMAALQALPTLTRTVGADTFTGVSLWSLLTSSFVGLATDPVVKNDVLGMYVVATGSDGYKALFSLGELSPDFGNQPDLIAFGVNGGSLGDKGFARIVAPNDVKAGRWVSNLVSLEVYHATAVPEPATVVLMLAGVVMLVMRRTRR